MSISDGPKITKDSSLIVNLDAANKKSYLGTGTNWTNLINKKNGILTNSPSFNSSNQGSLVFTRASNTYVDYGAVSGSFSSFSVIVWFYPTNIANYENILDCNYAYNGINGNIGPRLEMTAGGNLNWVYSNSASNGSYYYYQTVILSGMAANTWYCVGITYDGSGNSSVTYLNGLNTGNARVTSGFPTGFIAVMNNLRVGQGYSLGNQTSQRGFDGRVSSVQIYNRVLTSSEVYNNFVANRGRFGV